jgi:hypothetical protein
VIEPFWSALNAPVLIPNDPVVAFAATVTDPGTVRPDRPVLLRLTTAPLPPAAFDSVTVQFPLAFAPSVVGLHCSEEITVAAARLMFAVCHMPPSAAVIEPFWSALNAPVLIPNDPVVAFAATATEAGTVKTFGGKLVARVTITPPWGAAPDRVTVQVLLPFEPSVAGVHCREETVTEAPSVRDVLWEDPL